MSTAHPTRNRWKWLFIVLALASAMLLVVASACGGGDDDEGDEGGDKTPAASEPTDGDDEATETPHDGDDGDGGDVADALAAFADEYGTFEGMVKYEASGFDDIDTGGLTSMAIYQKGDKSRVDIESSDGAMIIITTPEATYTCTEGQCFQTEGDDSGSSLAAFSEFIDPSTIEENFVELPDGVSVDTYDEEIAGVDAKCFSAEGDLDEETPGDESGEVCFAEGGLLLRMSFASGGMSGSFEAVQADTEVDDDVFEPPFDVVDLSDLLPSPLQ